MMLLKCCTQYASQFGKLTSNLSTGKGQFSQLHSFCMYQGNAQNPPSWLQQCMKLYLRTSRYTRQIQKRQRDQRSNYQHLLDHRKSKGIPEKHQLCFISYAKAFDCVDHNKLWKILKEMGIPDHLTCLLRNLYVGQEATVGTGHGRMERFQIGKGCILSPCLFNLYPEYII